MEFRILGRTQVGIGDGEVALGGSQRRSLLAVLLVDAGKVVPAERLVDALWPVSPPMSAAQTVQSHVSHLRKLLGADRIETVSGGYRLVVEGAEVDAVAFEREFERGRVTAGSGDSAGAASLLEHALGRWRGDAFEDAHGCERAVAESARLEGLRISALELLLDARLALGQHDRVAADAEAAVGQWPLRERLWASLITALYRCGRHADALSAYQRVRTTLAEELGLEPSPSLAALEAQILQHDPALLRNPSDSLGARLAEGGGRAAPDLQSERRPGNLPPRLTPLIGRERESQRVAAALEAGRIVTLTGVGGVGKTRLAVHIADSAAAFPDGTWLCELAAVDSPEALFQVVAATLGVPTRAGAALGESLVDYLRSKELLVVLDNCEHLLTTAADLAESLLASCPEVRILATSREGLAIEGEQVIPLRSLELPPEAADPSVIAAAASVRLFVQRAEAAGADLALDDHDLRVLAEICRRLDGVPLALELAAARTAAMSPTDIAAHLDERFRLLTGGRRSAVERHQTLRAAVDWSYGLLPPRERIVFDRLAVFAGGFDLAAAQGVVPGDDITAFDVVDAVTSLVAKSMVVADRSVGGNVRYRLLETMRQYARDRLEESGLADDWRRRHARHYRTLAREAGPGFQGADEIWWRSRISEELDNLRAAVGWALDREALADAQLGFEIIVALVNEAMVRRSSGIGTWCHRALQRLDDLTPSQRYDVQTGAAWDLYQSGDIPAACAIAQQAIDSGVPDDVTYTAGAFVALATSQAMLGDLDAARAAFRAGRVAVSGRPDEPYSMAALLSAEAMNLAAFGHADARRCATEALAIALDVHNPTLLVLANFAIGWTLIDDDPAAARAALEESITLSEAGAIDATVGGALARLAPLRLRDGDVDGALAALLTGVMRLRELGDRTSLASMIDSAMGVLEDLGDLPGAALAAVVTGRPESSMIAHSPIEPGRREALLDKLRSAAPGVLDTAERRAAQLSADEILDVLVADLTQHRAASTGVPTVLR